MKLIKNTVVLALTAALGIAPLVGCKANNNSTDTASANTEETSDARDEETLPFSSESAMKALVVGVNNAWATDVYKDGDENAYDTDKFHGFVDGNGDYFVPFGQYFATVNGDSWRIDPVEVQPYTNGKKVEGTTYKISGDVQFDGKNYIINNVKMTSVTEDGEEECQLEPVDASVVYTVSPSLIGE